MSLENKFFDWVDFDDAGGFALQFYDCVLNADLDSNLKKGTPVDIIFIDFESGKMDLYFKDDDSGIPFKSFNLELNIIDS